MITTENPFKTERFIRALSNRSKLNARRGARVAMDDRVQYANPLSALVLRGHCERHFGVPLEQPSRWEEAFLRWYERHILTVDTDDIAIDRPIFLVGLPRCGSTMLQDILCSHPHVGYITNTMHQYRSCLCGAEDLRRRLRIDFRSERYIGDSVEIQAGSANEGHMFWAEWRGIDAYSLDFVDICDDELVGEKKEKLVQSIRRVLWCFGGSGNRFLNKNSNFLPYLDALQRIFPDARIVHLVRDPRACANSMIKLWQTTRIQEEKVRAELGTTGEKDLPFIPYPRLPRLREYIDRYGPDDIRTTANLWNDGVSLVNAQKPALRGVYEVRFEDILAEPEAEMRRICEFCELAEIQEQDSDFWRAVSRIGKTHHVNSYRDFEIVEDICRTNMQRYGYL